MCISDELISPFNSPKLRYRSTSSATQNCCAAGFYRIANATNRDASVPQPFLPVLLSTDLIHHTYLSWGFVVPGSNLIDLEVLQKDRVPWLETRKANQIRQWGAAPFSETNLTVSLRGTVQAPSFHSRWGDALLSSCFPDLEADKTFNHFLVHPTSTLFQKQRKGAASSLPFNDQNSRTWYAHSENASSSCLTSRTSEWQVWMEPWVFSSLEKANHSDYLWYLWVWAQRQTEYLQKIFKVDLRMSAKRSVGSHRNLVGLAIMDQFLLGKVWVTFYLCCKMT